MDTDDGRWERLFADVDAEFESLRRAELEAEVTDRTRREFALIPLVDRLRGAVGARLELWLSDGDAMHGDLRRVGPDWLVVHADQRWETLVPLAAVSAVAGLAARTGSEALEGRIAARWDLPFLLRRLARDRTPLLLTLRGGRTLSGTCDRVGRDFLELAEHSPGEVRRSSAVRALRSVPLAALVALRLG